MYGYRRAIDLANATPEPDALDYVQSANVAQWYSSQYPHTKCGEAQSPTDLMRNRQSAGVTTYVREIPAGGVQVWDGSPDDHLAARLFPTIEECEADLDNLDPSRNPADEAK